MIENMLVAKIRDYYRAVLSDCEKFYNIAPLNEFWGGLNLVTMRKIMNEARSLEDIVQGAQRTFMFSVNVTDDSKERAVKWLLRERASRLDEWPVVATLQEAAFSLPENNFMIDGRRYTPDFIRCTNIALRIAATVPISPHSSMTIVELGGGLGHLARVLRAARISQRHIIIDLPETLVFSYSFLRLSFPRAKIQLIRNPTDFLEDDADFVLVPVAYARCLPPDTCDLFLNTASMGEMRNETIRYWMTFIQEHLRPKYSFMLNRFLNTITRSLEWRRSENECQQHYDRTWEIESWTLEPRYTQCPYVDTRVSRYVEIVARRGEPGHFKAYALQLVDEVASEDWWRLRSEGHVMGMRDNPICVDGSMQGTLFKLWEILRLAPTQESVAAMVYYLNRLCRHGGIEFEEMEYYRNLLRLYSIGTPA